MTMMPGSTFSRVRRAERGALSLSAFTLIELLVVLGIMTILIAVVSPLVPSLLKGNQVDANVNTLTGILEEAREAATAGNTYVWVAFSDETNPTTGVWVGTIQSQDGTETGINSSVTTPSWTTSLTFPVANLSFHSKFQNLPNVQIDTTQTGAFLANEPATVQAKGVSTSSNPATTLRNTLTWTSTSTGTTVVFTHAIEFTPDGEAHVQVWNSNIQFGIYPATGGAAAVNNYCLFNVSRLTGKTTVFRN